MQCARRLWAGPVLSVTSPVLQHCMMAARCTCGMISRHAFAACCRCASEACCKGNSSITESLQQGKRSSDVRSVCACPQSMVSNRAQATAVEAGAHEHAGFIQAACACEHVSWPYHQICMVMASISGLYDMGFMHWQCCPLTARCSVICGETGDNTVCVGLYAM